MEKAQVTDAAVLYSLELLALTDPSKIINDMHDALCLHPSCRYPFLRLMWQHVYQDVRSRGGEVTRPIGAVYEALPAHIQPAIVTFLREYGNILWPDPVNEFSRQHLIPASCFPSPGYWAAQLGGSRVYEPHMSLHGSQQVFENYRLVDASMVPERTTLRLGKVLQLYISAMLRIEGVMRHDSQANTADPRQWLPYIVPQLYQHRDHFQSQRGSRAQPLHPQQAQHQPQHTPSMVTNPWAQQSQPSPAMVTNPWSAHHRPKAQPRVLNTQPVVPTMEPAPGGRVGQTEVPGYSAHKRQRWHRGARRGGRFPLREHVSPKDQSERAQGGGE